MDDRWNMMPDARRVQQHESDSRPAWLWSQDGQTLLWANPAAALFGAKLKKHGLKLAAPAVPIKGQVARIIRLGSIGRSSLARIQFLAGEKPVSATCATTPLLADNAEAVLLIVGVDPIAEDILAAAGELAGTPDPEAGMPPADAAPLETEAEPVAAADVAESAEDLPTSGIEPDAAYAHELQSWRDVDAETAYEPASTERHVAADDRTEDWVAALGDAPVDKATRDGDAASDEGAEGEAPLSGESAVSDGGTELHDPADEGETGNTPAGAEMEDVSRRLSDLVDRLAADEALYAPLTEEDDALPAPAVAQPEGEGEVEQVAPARLYTITGRGFVPLAPPVEDLANTPASAAPEGEPMSVEAAADVDPEVVERVSRYNFDELSRILTDRIGERKPQSVDTAAPQQLPVASGNGSGALVNLGGETLVLNRLPLGILVFRDQQVLFANRAITEMIGYDSVESLRQAGLAAIFPVMGSEGQDAGPVNHLVQRDGTLVPVTARLQSISWHGRPALMLSASTTEVRTGHEEAVKAFAQTFADIRGDGFIEASRNGVVNQANAPALTLLSNGKPLIGRPIASLVGEDDAVALRAFLERPARFAETARPCLTLRAMDGRADLLLFALGQAGVVSGYFALVNARQTSPARLGGPVDIDPALLARISRGVRRPLNTVIGFSDIIRSKAFGALENERYAAYADDISQAGQEIAALVDELDDYARLRDGRYLPQRASLDLTDLLEQCVLRIRPQANGARVIVRNAISERLPRVTADRASLAQAVLNLLASAIDQTTVGGAVVISAQRHDDGSIAIQVRDSSAHAVDMAERFVVFRDGVGRNGQVLAPVRSSVGLALTRSLLAVNAVSLAVDPAGPEGMLFTLRIPADLVDDRPVAQEAE
jgi:signal transduction histidine kinase